MIYRYFILHQFGYLNERHDIDLIALRNHLYENHYNLKNDLTAILCEIQDIFFKILMNSYRDQKIRQKYYI